MVFSLIKDTFLRGAALEKPEFEEAHPGDTAIEGRDLQFDNDFGGNFGNNNGFGDNDFSWDDPWGDNDPDDRFNETDGDAFLPRISTNSAGNTFVVWRQDWRRMEPSNW